jgi:hypothetical protein
MPQLPENRHFLILLNELHYVNGGSEERKNGARESPKTFTSTKPMFQEIRAVITFQNAFCTKKIEFIRDVSGILDFFTRRAILGEIKNRPE